MKRLAFVVTFLCCSALVSLFAQSPALSYEPVIGAVTPTSLDIHVRTTDAAAVQAEIHGQLTAPVSTSAAHDFTALIRVTGLTPETVYTYRVLVNGLQASSWHTVKTFPSETASRDARMVLFSDAEDNGRYAVYGRAADDNPDLLLQIGDWPHGNPEVCAVNQPVAALRINCWWDMYRDVIQDSFSLWSGARTVPLVYTWDDHDYSKGNATRAAKRKSLALQATTDYLPSYPRPNPTQGRWQSFRYGAAIEVFVLDLRYQKDSASNYDLPGMPDLPTHSMLDGANIANDQKTWLKAALLASTAQWKIVLSSLTFNPTVPKKDAWYGFQTESRELRQFVAANSITGLVLLSGDIHSGGGIDDGTYAGLREITVPKTNTPYNKCTASCGKWSAGIVNPKNTTGGYVLIDTIGTQWFTAVIKDYDGQELLRGTWDSTGGFTSVISSPWVILPGL